MKTKKIIALIAVLAMVLMAFAGCGSSKDTGSGDEILIGINYELSGAVAQYGQQCLDGIKLAVDQANENGGIDGKQIKLVEYDNKSDNNEAMSVATKLATKDNVCVILGPATSGATKAASNASQEYKVPVVSCSATADDVTVKDGETLDYVFRICYNDSFQGKVMGGFAADSLNAKKALILFDNASDYAKGLEAAFKEEFTSKGGAIVKEENFSSTDKDFSPILTKVKDLDFDVIYLPGYYEECGLVIKQARALGITQPILGADGYDSPTLTDIAGASALNDVYFTNHYSSGDPSPEVAEFVKTFKEKTGNDPSGFNALGYDMANFVIDAITRAGSTDADAVQKALAETENFSAVTGTFSIDKDHNPVKSTVVIELKDGVQGFNTRINP